MSQRLDEQYIAKLVEILSKPLDFATFEGVMQANIPELYRRTMVLGNMQCTPKTFEEFLRVLRHKIYGYLKDGHLLNNNYITLWFLYAQTALPKDSTLTQLIHLFETSYAAYHSGQKEKYIFAHLLCVLRMLNGDGQQSIAWFLGEHIWFEGKCYSQMDRDANALKNFCEQCFIPFDTVAQGIAEALMPDRFLNATYPERMGIGIWILGFFWQVKGYENHPMWCELIYPRLRELFLTCKEQKWIEEAMSLHFVMNHIFMNHAQTKEEFKQFNDEVEKEASLFYASWAENNQLPLPKEVLHVKKRMALIKDRIVENSPSKVEFSFLSALAKDASFVKEYELIVYSMATIEKSLDDKKLIQEIKQLGFDVSEVAFQSLNLQSNFQSHLMRALAIRNDMLKREVDIMIIASNNMPIGNFLFSTRSAATQIFWSHGNFEYDVLGIDKRVSHFVRESSFQYSKFDVQILEKFHKPDEEKHKALAVELRKRWSDEVIILGSIGRLVKMDNDDYMQILSEIMRANPNTIYLACGTGNEESLKQKIVKYDIPQNRFFFEGFVNPHVYGYVIDIYLNTFPEPGGESVNEFLSKGENKYVVSLEN